MEKELNRIVRSEMDREQADELLPGHIDLINQGALKPVKADEIHVRSVYIASDQVADDGLKFSRGALEQIASEIQGKSLLVGHDKTMAPIARFYHAEIARREGSPATWVRAWFFWTKLNDRAAGVESIAGNIDSGVWKDSSVSFRVLPTQVRNREILQVKNVLEGSVVYMPSDEGTVFAGARAAGTNTLQLDTETINRAIEPIKQEVAQLQTLLASKDSEIANLQMTIATLRMTAAG